MTERSASEGSILIEVLVAFAVAALVLVASLQQFSDGLGRTTRTREVLAGLEFARSKLATIQAAARLRPGSETGPLAPNRIWSVRVAEMRPGARYASGRVRPFLVEVQVLGARDGAVLADLRSIIISEPFETSSQ